MFSAEDLKRLHRYACSLTHNEQEAYDILSSSIEQVLRRDKSSTIEHPLRYTMRVIKNQFINMYKIKHRETPVEDIDETSDTDLETFETFKLDAEKVLSLCSPEEREILFLWAYEGMSYSEIAEQLEVSRGTLLSKIHRLKLRLQEQLKTEENQ